MQVKISICILSSIVCMFLSSSAPAAQWGDFTYEETGGDNITITQYTGIGGVVEIPAAINGKTVIRLGNDAFFDCTGLTRVTIPGSIKNIEYCAFNGCTGLTSVTLMNGVTNIGDNVFYGCTGLTNINIPASTTSIGGCAFRGCTGLTSIIIPASVTNIGDSVFYECAGLTSVTIQSSITAIPEYAFYGCSNLTSVTIPGNITSIGTAAFFQCSALSAAFFYGNAPAMEDIVFLNCASNFAVYYLASSTGFTNPWHGYPASIFDPITKTTTSVPSTTTSVTQDTTTTTTSSTRKPCPAESLLGEDTQSLEKLRALRDGPLAHSAAGRMVTLMYYKNADSINAAIDRSPALQAFARKFFKTVASLMQNKKLIICTPTY